jgi:CBS domain-containing protein
MHQWRVRDVMTGELVTAGTNTPVAELARLLATHRISAVPIIDDHGRVFGIVSEADLLPKVAAVGSRAPHRLPFGSKAAARCAADVMTTRPATIAPDDSLAAAAKMMQAKKVERLLVTDHTGQLLGVVSRTDLLRPFTRPDAAIRQDVIHDVLRRTLWIDPTRVHVDVDAGVVTLTGAVGRRTTAAIAARLTAAVPGVVAVVDHVAYAFDDTALARSRVNRTHPFSAEPFPP